MGRYGKYSSFEEAVSAQLELLLAGGGAYMEPSDQMKNGGSRAKDAVNLREMPREGGKGGAAE